MFEIEERTNDVNRRGFVVRNTETGREFGPYRFHDDAVQKMRTLENARMRRLRDANVRQFGGAK